MTLDEVRVVLDALRAADCPVWAAGGWAVDALVGKQTRPHQDLDLAIDAAALDPALGVLEGHGYAVEVDWLPVRVDLHRPGYGAVDLHPVVFDERGDGVQEGFGAQVFLYSAGDLVRGTLPGGESVGCLSAQLQLRFRRGYQLRDVDRHDIEILVALGQF